MSEYKVGVVAGSFCDS